MQHIGGELTKNEEKYIKDVSATYTTIIHQVRNRFGLSITEYCVADTIHKLSSGEKSRKLGGWVYASKQTLADGLGVSRITVIRAINKLIELKLLERDPDTNYLTTTGLWWKMVETYKRKIIKG